MDFKRLADLIMIEQTLFALPFALVGVLFAGGGSIMTWIWVGIALAAARTAGMSFNRVIDADIDAKNPRTRERIVASGEVNRVSVWLTAVAASLIFIFAAYMLNPLCFYLSFVCVLLLFTYSFLKRFTAASHFYLGLIEAAAPAGGYLAVTGRLDMVAVLLGLVILAWIAGLDIVYAFADMEFDKQEKLHSLPVDLGPERALKASRICYGVAVAGLVLAGLITGKGGPYWIALVVIGLVFFYQQVLAGRTDDPAATARIFSANLWISPVLLLGTLIDLFPG
ncbi:MAG: UbiA-like polyprenyltransferase [Thermodesulfobacteriota bacterium]|nr:UbiA-like polyprenyltransferase [Thermodesulfobacteriota bacterium]